MDQKTCGAWVLSMLLLLDYSDRLSIIDPISEDTVTVKEKVTEWE